MNDIQTRPICFRETLRQKQERTVHPIILFGLDCSLCSRFFCMGIARLLSSEHFAILSLKNRGVMVAELSGARSARSGENWVRKFS